MTTLENKQVAELAERILATAKNNGVSADQVAANPELALKAYFEAQEAIYAKLEKMTYDEFQNL